jgi:predicted nucleic acid-binding protein
MHIVVLDTNVIIAALPSRRGASFARLRQMGQDRVPLISLPLILEYEAVAKRECQVVKIPQSTVDALIGAFCFLGRETDTYFRLRPFLPDADDEFLLDLAVAGQAEAIITHNVRHFLGVERFGLRVMTPREFLKTMKEGT